MVFNILEKRQIKQIDFGTRLCHLFLKRNVFLILESEHGKDEEVLSFFLFDEIVDETNPLKCDEMSNRIIEIIYSDNEPNMEVTFVLTNEGSDIVKRTFWP